MDNEYLSIKDFASRAGVSPQAIYQRLNKDLKPFLETRNGKKVLSVQALPENRIKEKSRIYQSSENKDILINTLLNQLETKDQQIQALTDALTAEQRLHAEARQQIRLLQGTAPGAAQDSTSAQDPAPDEAEEATPKQETEPEQFAQEEHKKKSSWWHRFWYGD